MENDLSERMHSGLAIASFATSIISGISLILVVVFAGLLEAATPGGMNERSAIAAIIGLLVILFLGLALVALGLGIAGLFQRTRKKVFAILGVTFSAVAVLCTGFIMFIGLAAK